MARSPRRWLGCCLAATAVAAPAPTASAVGLPPLHDDRTRMVDPAGRPVLLKGCNLGNTLVLESWMFGDTLVLHGRPFKDQATLYRTLRQRFGDDRFEHLVDVYRTGYVTARDFDLIKSFGFNVVRLPFDYRLLQRDEAPFGLKPDAFKYPDHVVGLAARAGVYVILDLHGTPGGQSGQDHTGEAGQNHLWGSAVNRGRTVDLWRELAGHYKGNPTVAAYDLINEPYGDGHTDERPELATLMPDIYRAVRSTGDRHVVFFPGALDGGTDFYGDLRSEGLTGVGLTEHDYTGLFGSPATLENQAVTLNGLLPAKAAAVAKLGVPYLVGEFNVVQRSEWPERVMRAYEDRFAAYGWSSAMWSYKLLKRGGGAEAASWYMVTNAGPLPPVDAATASYADLEAFVARMATMPLAVNEPLRHMLTTPTPPPLYLAEVPRPVTAVPATASSDPPGYASANVGPARAGHTAAGPDGRVTVYAAGADVHGTADDVRFVSRVAGADPVDERATILSLPPTDRYSKAGVMVRWGAGPGAAMVMVNAFPDGTLAVMARPTPGGGTTETKVAAGVAWPVELRLRVDHGKAAGGYRLAGGDWQPIATAACPTAGDRRVGLAVTSHADGYAVVTAALGGPAADAALAAAPDAGTALPLVNPTFSSDARGWDRWGRGLSPTDGGLAFAPTADGGSTGLWQDLPVEPGRRYTLSVDAGGPALPGGTLDLRLESVTAGGELTLNSRTWDLATLPAGRLARVACTAQTDRLRAMVVLSTRPGTTGRLVLRSASVVMDPSRP